MIEKDSDYLTKFINMNPKDKTFRVRFRKVGQGDTIILEWYKENLMRIGIIDCKDDENSRNAAIAYLNHLLFFQEEKFKIEFVFFSHPHDDHCEGAVCLMEFLSATDLLPERFGTTIEFDHNFKGSSDVSEELVNKIRHARERYFPQPTVDWLILAHEVSFDLNDHYELRCLSPEPGLLKKYYDIVDGKEKMSTEVDSSIANLLSTIITISSKNKYCILTSDTPLTRFKLLSQKTNYKIFTTELWLAQVPHHGSKHNFFEPFWQQLKNTTPHCKAVISVGKNSYGHPSGIVVTLLGLMKYEIETTDQSKVKKRNQHKYNDKYELSEQLHRDLLEISGEVDHGHEDIVHDWPL